MYILRTPAFSTQLQSDPGEKKRTCHITFPCSSLYVAVHAWGSRCHEANCLRVPFLGSLSWEATGKPAFWGPRLERRHEFGFRSLGRGTWLRWARTMRAMSSIHCSGRSRGRSWWTSGASFWLGHGEEFRGYARVGYLRWFGWRVSLIWLIFLCHEDLWCLCIYVPGAGAPEEGREADFAVHLGQQRSPHAGSQGWPSFRGPYW